jgi:hypothetical protein
MPLLLAIDPGTEQSAWIGLDKDGMPHDFGINTNEWVKELVKKHTTEHLAIEMIASYGMPVGKEVFETVLFIGQLMEAWGKPCELIYRADVKMHLCHQTAKVNDSVIRQALLDRFGPGKKAMGTKKQPGPLYGVSKDVWAALGVAVTWYDTKRGESE